MEQEYIDALRKSALGYEYVEQQEYFEETNTSKKKKIIKVHKQVPPNPQAIQLLMELEQKEANELAKLLDTKKK